MMHCHMLRCTITCYDALSHVMMHCHMLRCTVTCYDALSHVMMHCHMLRCTVTCYDALSHVTMHGHMNVKKTVYELGQILCSIHLEMQSKDPYLNFKVNLLHVLWQCDPDNEVYIVGNFIIYLRQLLALACSRVAPTAETRVRNRIL